MNPTGFTWSEARAIHVDGAGAADFLQGYLTADARRLQAAQAVPMALCNVKGRVLASGWALTHTDGVALVVHHSVAERVITFLTPYARFAKCSLNPAPQPVWVYSGSGDNVVADDWGLDLTGPETDHADASEALNRSLVQVEYAWISEPVSEKFLPQVLALDQRGAVDFDKGCYLGQEIVARAQFRGAVKRFLQSFVWQGSAPAVGSTRLDHQIVINTASAEGDATRGRGLAVASH